MRTNRQRWIALGAVAAMIGIALVLIPLIGRSEYGGWNPATGLAVVASMFVVLVLPRVVPQLWRNRRRLRAFLRGDPN